MSTEVLPALISFLFEECPMSILEWLKSQDEFVDVELVTAGSRENNGSEFRKPGLWARNAGGKSFRVTLERNPAEDYFVVKPDMIEPYEGCGLMGASGLEDIPGKIIRFAQESGGWVAFTSEDVDVSERALGDMVQLGFLHQEEDGRYRATYGFVADMFMVSCIEAGISASFAKA